MTPHYLQNIHLHGTENNMSNTQPESLLGRTARGPIPAQDIEVWDLPGSVNVSYYSTEFSALCPVTRQPDLYTVSIDYELNKTFESKGLKHYLWGFRDVGMGCEELAITLATQLADRIGGRVSVYLSQQVRGGLELSATHVATP